jgi:hypothetical protein
MDWMTNPSRKRRMSHDFVDHKNQQQNNGKSTNPIPSALKANGAPMH